MKSRRYPERVVFIVVAVFVAALPLASAAQAPTTTESASADNAELAQLYREDQSDRMPADSSPIDWKVVGPRDKAREARIKELYSTGRLQTGADYYHAAMILQHSAAPEDCLLAHELCVAALIKGEERAKWLAAASEDRFLMRIGRPQRFGTQYRSDSPGAPMALYQMDSVSVVTNQLCLEFDVPAVESASSKARRMRKYILPDSIFEGRSWFDGEVSDAMERVERFFRSIGFNIDAQQMIDTVVILGRGLESRRQQLSRMFGVQPEDVPETFCGTVMRQTLILVTEENYWEIWDFLYSDWPRGWSDVYQELIVHELAHKAHEQIAIEQTGSADGMGPEWFFEGLATLCARQFDDGKPPLTNAELMELIGDGKIPPVSYPVYSRIVRSMVKEYNLKDQILHASDSGFPFSLDQGR